MGKVVSNDGTLIAYALSGAGPPLVLIHGTTADHTRWAPVLPPLEQRFAVYALDRRGRGGSGDTEPYALQREVEDVAAVIGSIGGPVDVLAHSFGAICALEAALLTPNIRKLILYEPPLPGPKASIPPETRARMRAYLASGDNDNAIATFLLEVAQVPPDEVALMRSLPSWEGRVAAAHTILRELESIEALPQFDAKRFEKLKTPTLLLLGGASPAGYDQSIKLIHAILSNSRIVVLPGQRHQAMNTAPELFLGEVLAFLLDTNYDQPGDFPDRSG
jgi:pimeloyl-ACP methyl ester carboxylesterase